MIACNSEMILAGFARSGASCRDEVSVEDGYQLTLRRGFLPLAGNDCKEIK